MARLRNVPPGRAGHLWLQHRLVVARRGAELLDQKLRILHEESQRLSLLTERTGAAWAASLREAETWLLRAVILTGERGVRLASRAPSALVEVSWTHQMGVRYPGEVTLTVPPVPAAAPPAASAALVGARVAYERALDAAVQHAAAQAAARLVAAEEGATRRRLRALTRHWIPRLTEEMAQTLLTLEEQERTDALRLRWAQPATRTFARHPGSGDES